MQQKWRVLKFTESHDPGNIFTAFAAVDWAEKTAGFLLNVVCLHSALESSAHFVDAQAHTMWRRRIIAHADVQVLSSSKL